MSSDSKKEDLDAFLIAVESKLRAPFSSLDLAKAVRFPASSGISSSREYLENIKKVLPRMEKSIQLRVLVGLLGLEPSNDINNVIYDILSKAQEKETMIYDWVRVVAGLVQGIMYGDDLDNNRGKEAEEQLVNTCKQILKQIQEQQREKTTATKNGSSQEDSTNTDETDPLFSPYRYSLLDPKLLSVVIPETQTNSHFTVNTNADILSVDSKLEEAEAKEEQDIQKRKLAATKLQQQQPKGLNGPKTSTTAPRPVPTNRPGGSSSSSNNNITGVKNTRGIPGARLGASKSKASTTKSSMFIQAKKPTGSLTGGRLGQQFANMKKAGIRKPGTAQALLAKGRRQNLGVNRGLVGSTGKAGAGSSSSSGATGRTAAASSSSNKMSKLSNARSKMKMIGISEVQGLTKEHQDRQSASRGNDNKKLTKEERKRKLMEQAAAKGLVKTSKRSKVASPAANSNTSNSNSNNKKDNKTKQQQQPSSNGALQATAAAALLAYQQQVNEKPPDDDGSNNYVIVQSSSISEQQGSSSLHQLLERSNRLSGDDRTRIKQFFENKYNPTPDIPIYKMKLNEEESIDPSTGQVVKETLYLELNYNTFGFKQLRKLEEK